MPSKQRGPARAIEFLGMLIVNSKDRQCVGLTRKRLEMLKGMIADWQGRHPREAEASDELQVKPAALAKLLGHLVFASQVVAGARRAACRVACVKGHVPIA